MDTALKPPAQKKAILRENWPAHYGAQRVSGGGGGGGGGGDASTLNGQPGNYYRALENSTGNFDRGINWGSTLAASPQDLSEHISLWSTTFGFSITSGQLNYVVSSSAAHAFYRNTTLLATFDTVARFAITTFFPSNSGPVGSGTGIGPSYVRLRDSVEANLGYIGFATGGTQFNIGSNIGFVELNMRFINNIRLQDISAYAALVNQDTGAGATTFGLGHTVAATANGGLGIPDRNATQPVRLEAGNTFEYTMQGAGTVLSGTYRARGVTNDSPAIMLMERVA